MSSSSSQQQCQAKFAFIGQSAEELSVRQGEVLTQLPQTASDGWVLCENAVGKRGYVPESYLAVLPAPAPRRSAPRPPPMPKQSLGEVDKSSIPFEQTLGGWKERERKFMMGEAELLPLVRPREYYYWDRQGRRQGPLTERDMQEKFSTAQVELGTMIAPITTALASEALPKLPVQAYFADESQVFATAPIPAPGVRVGDVLWLYLDDAGQVQGPFASAQMRDWFLDRYFNAETRVKLASSKPGTPFARLGDFFPGDGSDSFLSEGRLPPQQTSMEDPFAAPPPPAATMSGRFTPPPLANSPAPVRGRSLLNMAMGASSRGSNNPFESADFSAPPPPPPPAMGMPAAESDDWGVVWGDEEPSATTSTTTSGVPAPAESKDTRKLAAFDYILKTHLSDHNAVYHFLTRALQKDLGTVRCKIKRSIEGLLHLNYNRYDLYLERDDGTLGPIVMTAIKYKRMLGVDNYYELQVGAVSPTHSGTVIGEIMLTSMGAQFLLHNNVKLHSGRPRDLACVHYLSTGAEGGPRKMTVGIPGFLPDSEQEFVEWAHQGSIKRSNLVSAIESLNFKNIQPLVNKPPVWSEKRGAWTLNFHGRVTRASVKNFQLCRPEDFDHVVLQHGRVGHDTFTMDVAWPMSIMQGLTVCISSLHAKLGVE